MELVDIEPEQDAGQKETCTAIGYVGLEEGLDSIAGLTIAFLEDITIAPVIGVEDADCKGYGIGQEVMEADVDSDVDAKTIESLGVKTIQLHSGGLCHMDADMTARGLQFLGLEDLDVVIMENIGNLVCPAEFDTGAHLKAMILSIPEGDDKPLKYPLMFETVDAVLVSKIDAKEVFDFDEKRFENNLRIRNQKAPVFYLSNLNKEGIEAWTDYLINKIEEFRKS